MIQSVIFFECPVLVQGHEKNEQIIICDFKRVSCNLDCTALPLKCRGGQCSRCNEVSITGRGGFVLVEVSC
jgi:hypothetical protein